MGIGSLYETSSGLRATSLQDAAHFSQCPLAATNLIVERSSAIFPIVVRKLLHKRVHLTGFTVSMEAYIGRLCPGERVVRRR